MSRLRSNLYRSARTLGDLEAAAKGPAPLARRLVRKRIQRGWLGLLERFLR